MRGRPHHSRASRPCGYVSAGTLGLSWVRVSKGFGAFVHFRSLEFRVPGSWNWFVV